MMIPFSGRAHGREEFQHLTPELGKPANAGGNDGAEVRYGDQAKIRIAREIVSRSFMQRSGAQENTRDPK